MLRVGSVLKTQWNSTDSAKKRSNIMHVESYLRLTVSRDAEARRSGRKPTSNIWSRKLWSSMPYTRSRKSTMGALWSGQKLADTSGSVTVPSEH